MKTKNNKKTRIEDYKYLVAIKGEKNNEIYGFKTRKDRIAFIMEMRGIDSHLEYAISTNGRKSK